MDLGGLKSSSLSAVIDHENPLPLVKVLLLQVDLALTTPATPRRQPERKPDFLARSRWRDPDSLSRQLFANAIEGFPALGPHPVRREPKEETRGGRRVAFSKRKMFRDEKKILRERGLHDILVARLRITDEPSPLLRETSSPK